MKKYLQSIMDKAVQDGVFPGCVASVYYQGQWTRVVAGEKAIYPKEEENTMDTLYDLASLSKVVSTTMIVLKMIEEKKLSLDDHINQYIKKCPWEDITIAMLLTHTSGLPPIIDVDRNDTKETIFERIWKLSREHIGEVVYSDVGFIVLQFVLETISKKPLDILANEYVFHPLGMQHTLYCPSQDMITQCAPTEASSFLGKIVRGEVHDEKAYQMGGVAGHAGVFSCIHDLEKYASMMLDKQRYLPWHLKKLCYRPYYQNMTIPRGIGFLSSDKEIGSALSTTIAYHTGFCGNSILLDFDKQIAIIVLSNRIHPTRNNDLILSWRKPMHDLIYQYIENYED